MGLEDDVRAFDQTNRATVDKLRGPAPAGLIEAIIIGETCGDRFSLASDAALDETGLSSEPLYIAWKNDVDPCDTVGGIWLRCLCTGRDGMELLDHHKDLFVAPCRDLWFCTILAYSIGKGALAHVLGCVERLYPTRAAVLEAGFPSVEAAIIAWAKRTDLSLPVHRHHWGRQSPALILHRITGPKHRTWLDVAAKLSPLDGPAGPVTPKQRPGGVPPFPDEIVGIAKYLLFAGATKEQLKAKAKELRRYLNRRRRQANAPKAPLLFRIRRFLERGRSMSGRRMEVA